MAIKLLGTPDSKRNIPNPNENVTSWTYNCNEVVESGKVVVNHIILTFHKDLLESYCYDWYSGKQSSQKIQIATALRQLNKGSSTKADAIASLGEPTGKGGCRTSERESTEIWYWLQPLKEVQRNLEVDISFDPSGVIAEIKQSESKSN